MKEPVFRFKGYTDDWEQRKWADTIDISTEMVDPTEDKYQEMPHIAPGNIESFTGKVLNNVKKVKEEQLISGKFRFRPGDVVYGKINPQLGKYFYSDTDGLTSADAYVLNGKNGIKQKFLYAVLQTRDFFNYSVSVSKRTGMPKINRDELNAYSFMAPSEDEQERIGEYLIHFDNLIALNQRKCDALKELKKGMLQKIFPKDGEKVPEFRFKGFTGDWEQRKVGDIFRVTRGYVLPATETDENYSDEKPYPVYSSQTKNNGLMGYYDKYLYENAITWTTDGANAGTVNYRSRKFYCTNVCGVLLSDDGFTNKMVAEALNAVAWKHVSHVGNPKLMNNVMSEIKINLPKSIEEQQKISDYLTNLDNLIALHQRKCDALKELKKGFLQKMFV